MNSTIRYYDEHAEEYVNQTKDLDMRDIHDRFLKYLHRFTNILDLGCGSGRDTLYFLDKGFNVDAVDGSENMCRLAEQNIGRPVFNYDILDLDSIEYYDGIWACASLLHLNREELKEALRKILKALKNNGIFYCSFKYSDVFKTETINDKTYSSMDLDGFIEIMKEVGIDNLKIVESWISIDSRFGNDTKWLNIILRKTETLS